MKEPNNTLVFIDEIQAYPHLLTLSRSMRMSLFRSGKPMSPISITMTTKRTERLIIIIGDCNNVSLLPIEGKSGKGYTVNSILDYFLSVQNYDIKNGIVFSNDATVRV